MAAREPGPPLFAFFWAGTVAAIATAVAVAAGFAVMATTTSSVWGTELGEIAAVALMIFGFTLVIAWPVWMAGLFSVGFAAWAVLRRWRMGPLAAASVGAVLAGGVAWALTYAMIGGGSGIEPFQISFALGAWVGVCGAGVGWAALWQINSDF